MTRLSRFAAIAVIASKALSVNYAFSQQEKLYSERVTLTAFNASKNTFTAEVRITASVCPGDYYDISLLASSVKDPGDARQQVQAQVEEISKSTENNARACATPLR
jgi:hypothetical protein